MKKIVICNKEYPIACNALTYITFRKKFDRGIFEDIKVIRDFLTKQTITTMRLKEKFPDITDNELIKELSNIMLSDIDLYIEAVTRLAYICIYSADENFKDYEEWLKEIERINTNDPWIAEVTEYAVDCFC